MQTHPDISELHQDPPCTERRPGGDFYSRMCSDKTRYADKRDAQTAMNKFKTKRGRHGRPERLRAYACPLCRGWHLTKGDNEHC
jgi:hypothetical protein